MEKQIVVTKRFKNNTANTYNYILNKHSLQTANDFLDKLQQRIEFISQYPEAGKTSQITAGVRSSLLLPYNKIYYRITENAIELLCLFNMKRNKQPY